MDEKKSAGDPDDERREDNDGEKAIAASRLQEQRRILELFGTVDFDPEYDYKAARRKKRS
jgi:hypothetical protein